MLMIVYFLVMNSKRCISLRFYPGEVKLAKVTFTYILGGKTDCSV